ncbi:MULTISPECIES: class 1 isoprenoid biosynthesis enzyme [unclassified Crossiella]|uniref:class 1 isoprenoid biosynthesis enzyme n=1 Tax=unclassified Crossiella TaxID=2620835 RepID=UPI0020003F1D|nr:MULTISPECIES: class 1 isoprenoid biosynthesis enzyme [unclassified Crossiella]MCK2239226.1 class 1 isoprenoid biosynthesis enzyme [Crossiella sp. S99.2]MCK2251205.1 class 1 isoprenoid biosynthesis enzyme [Crossiella sp. S99.1]
MARAGLLADLGALLRWTRFAGRIPRVPARAAEYAGQYDRVIAPIMESTVDSARRERIGRALKAASVKLGFLLGGYAAMAGLPLRSDLAALSGAVTRAYDDLIDDFGSPELDRRLAELFRGGDFQPAGDLERLFHGLFREVERRLGRDRGDPIFTALRELHGCQVESRLRQGDPAIPAAELARITAGKGGFGTVVLFALVKPGMPERELALVHELGGVLQQLDDYQDVELDRRAGVVTAATRDGLTLAQVCTGLRALAPRLYAHYGRVRPLYAVVYAYLWASFLRRHLPRLGSGGGTPRGPLGFLLRPGDNLVQPAAHRRR